MSGGRWRSATCWCFGRPACSARAKRRWRCPDRDGDAKTWTEASPHIDAQVALTRRAGANACRRVGEHAEAVSSVAGELGVCWWTVMNAVVEHGTPLVDDPDRVGPVSQLGVDETSFLKANHHHATIYATGLVDLDADRVIEITLGNAASDLRRWCAGADPVWLAGIEVVATDLTDSYAAGLSPHLGHVLGGSPIPSTSSDWRTGASTRFGVGPNNASSVIGAARPTRCIGSASCPPPATNDSTTRVAAWSALGLRAGDPDGEVQAAWVAKETVRDVYLAETRDEAHTLLALAVWRCATEPTRPRSAPSAGLCSSGSSRSSPASTPAPATDRPRA